MQRNPIPQVILAAALSACSLQPELLNSERIERSFGSYGIEVLSQNSAVRRSNLYSSTEIFNGDVEFDVSPLPGRDEENFHHHECFVSNHGYGCAETAVIPTGVGIAVELSWSTAKAMYR